jgi:hypothetical protein
MAGCCGGGGSGPKQVVQNMATANQGSAISGENQFVLRNPDGSKTYFSTESQARAANAQQGNVGLVRPA